MNGILVINKPSGFTSFDVVAVMRKATGERKIGHLGTLDPNARGVLPLALGSAAKAQDLVVNHDKGYEADFKLGIKTDTLDIWGKVVAEKISAVSKREITEKIVEFTGDILQTPPMYSAVHINGKRLYELARQGKTVERKKRPVTVYNIELKCFDREEQKGTLLIQCSKGTYIRTLIDDLGEALGTCAVMTNLVRTEACGYTLKDAVDLQEARTAADFSPYIKSTESLFTGYGCVRISPAQARRFSNGGALDKNRTSLAQSNPPEDTILRVRDNSDNFLGLGIVRGNELKIYKLFK